VAESVFVISLPSIFTQKWNPDITSDQNLESYVCSKWSTVYISNRVPRLPSDDSLFRQRLSRVSRMANDVLCNEPLILTVAVKTLPEKWHS